MLTEVIWSDYYVYLHKYKEDNKMDLQARKLNIIEHLIAMQDEKVCAKIEKLIDKAEHAIKPDLKVLTKEELMGRAQKSNEQIDQSCVISQEDLESQAENW